VIRTDNTRDRGWKLDKHGLTLVNFKNLVHKGDQITNEIYVLTSQVEQVFYVEDERDPNWACAVRTKPRNVYDVGQGQGPDDTKQITMRASLSSWIIIIIMIHKKRT
jgi:hypothetical protein